MAIDQNSRNTILGLIHGTRETIPVTITNDNKLLLEVIPVTSFSAPVPATKALPIDENSRSVTGGIDNGDIYPFLLDELNNFPLLRVEFI